jgi:ABC transporter substrate binding protein
MSKDVGEPVVIAIHSEYRRSRNYGPISEATAERVKIRMAPPRLARRISWRRHEIAFRPLKFCATKFRARRRVSHPYLPPYSLVARRYSTEFAAEVRAAFRSATANRADGLTVAGNARNFVHREKILEFAASNRLPAAYGWKEAIEDGGLLSYGPDVTQMWRRAAVYVDKILKGAKPADLPVEQPTTFELVINLKTAKVLGLTIPPSLLLRADQIIE